MGQTSGPALVDSDGEFFREEGLTFEDLALQDRFSVQDKYYRKLTDNSAMRVDLGPDQGGFGTFLPSQPVTRYGNFEDFRPGVYVTRQPIGPAGVFSPPFARLSVGEVFVFGDINPPTFYRKLTPTKAVRLNPDSPLLKKALNPEAVS